MSNSEINNTGETREDPRISYKQDTKFSRPNGPSTSLQLQPTTTTTTDNEQGSNDNAGMHETVTTYATTTCNYK